MSRPGPRRAATGRGLVAASHAGPTAVVTLLAGAFALGAGAGVGRAALVTAAVLAGQLSVGWSNDWLDARRDVAVGRAGKPVVDGLVTATLLRRCALGALAVCAALSFATGWLPGVVHLVAVASAWAYNLRLKSSVWSWVPYAVSFGLLPAFVTLAVRGETPAAWVVGATALLGVGAHVANTLPDLEDDVATGVRGLPHRLGRRWASVVAPVVLVAGVLVAAAGLAATAGPAPGLGLGGRVPLWAGGFVAAGVALATAGGVLGWTRPTSRAPFALSMAVAAVCVVLLVAGLRAS